MKVIPNVFGLSSFLLLLGHYRPVSTFSGAPAENVQVTGPSYQSPVGRRFPDPCTHFHLWEGEEK